MCRPANKNTRIMWIHFYYFMKLHLPGLFKVPTTGLRLLISYKQAGRSRPPSVSKFINYEPRTILRRMRGKVKTLPCSSDACQLKQKLLPPTQATQPEKNVTGPPCAPHTQFLVCHGKRGHKHLGSTFPSRSRRFVVSAPTKDETTSGTYHVSDPIHAAEQISNPPPPPEEFHADL